MTRNKDCMGAGLGFCELPGEHFTVGLCFVRALKLLLCFLLPRYATVRWNFAY